MSALSQIFSLSLFLSLPLIAAFVFWKKVWFDQYGAEIPIDKSINAQIESKKRLYMRTKTGGIFWSTFSKLAKALDMEYWVTHCGNDGYLYLLFQRRFLKLTIWLSGVTLCISLFTNFFILEDELLNEEDEAQRKTLIEGYFDRSALNNKDFSSYKGWVHVLMVFVHTFLTIHFVQKTRRDARVSYQMYYKEMSKKKDHEWLKARTLHIRGIPAEDRAGIGLRMVLEVFLNQHNGRVLDLQIVPPFHNILDIEQKMRDLKEMNMLLSSTEDNFYCCVPRTYKDINKFEAQMEKYEEELEQESMRRIVPSGHAFVCFDSINSLEACQDYFQPSPFTYAGILWMSFKDKFYQCLGVERPIEYEFNRNRARSTFHQFDDLDEQEVLEKYRDATLIMSKCTEPSDIIWSNMKGARGLFVVRRICLFLLGLVIVVFVSSPTVLFSNLKKIDTTGVFTFGWADKLSGDGFFSEHFPPLCILGINQLLIFIIDITCRIEYYETHSLYQRALYLKCAIYLSLNMILIPALTLGNLSADAKIDTTKVDKNEQVITSLWSFMIAKNFNLRELMSEVYVGDNGTFFVSLIVQQAFLSSAFYLTNATDILFAYFSPWLAHMQRKVYQDQEPWLRKLENTFQFGYFYAQMITIFGICIFFSSTIPAITVCCSLYAFIRHSVDCLNLLTVFRKEIDSQGLLIDAATNSALVIVVLYQMFMMAFFVTKEMLDESLACTFIFIFSVFYIVLTYEKVNEHMAFDEETESKFIGATEDTSEAELQNVLNKWRTEYSHPSIVSKSRRKQAFTMNDVFQELDDWSKFQQNSHVKDLFAPSIYPRESGVFRMTQELGQKKAIKKLTTNDRNELIEMTSQAIQAAQKNNQSKRRGFNENQQLVAVPETIDEQA